MTKIFSLIFSFFIFSSPSLAKESSCQAFLSNFDIVRAKLSSLPIVAKHNKTLGSHGAYRGVLSDGTQVIVKPHDEDWFASIPKEVGASIFAELIGLPIIPTSSYRIDPYSGLPASVHLYISDAKSRNLGHQLLNLVKFHREKNQKSRLRLQGEILGTDVNFLILLLGYSDDEISERHILRRSHWYLDDSWKPTRSQDRYLIDLGSAFLRGYFYLPTEDELSSVKIPESALSSIENLDFDIFSDRLEHYFPAQAIKALYNRTRLLAKALRTLDPKTNEIDINAYQKIRDEHYGLRKSEELESFYIQQKWKWNEAQNPPQIAIDFDI